MANEPKHGRSSLSKRKKHTGPSHRSSNLAGAIAICILLAITGLRLGGDLLFDFPKNPEINELPKKLAIICLAGGKKRVETAFKLFAGGIGDRFLIVGAGPKSTVNGLARALVPEVLPALNPARLLLAQVETDSRNTIENAFAVDSYLHKNPEVDTILLVTSAYHMRRAKLLIELQSKRPITIIPYTPENEAIELSNWWRSWLGVEVTLIESLKLLFARILVPRLDML